MRRICLFLVAVVVLTTPFWWLVREFGGTNYVLGMMYAPCFAAVAALKLTGGDLGSLGWRGTALRWNFLAWAVIVALIAATHVVGLWAGAGAFPDMAFVAERAGKMGMVGFPTAAVVLAYALLSWTFGIVGMSANALGEELGWRGFLTVEIYTRWGFTGSSLAVGLLWSLWHFPLLIGNESPLHILWFTLSIMGGSFIYTWFRLASRSVWPAVVLHGTHNALLLGFWGKVVVYPEGGVWLTQDGETGIALAVAYVLAGFAFWLNRHRAEALWAAGDVRLADPQGRPVATPG